MHPCVYEPYEIELKANKDLTRFLISISWRREEEMGEVGLYVYESNETVPNGKKRPNPLDISDAVFGGHTGNPSARNRTALLVFFGEFEMGNRG